MHRVNRLNLLVVAAFIIAPTFWVTMIYAVYSALSTQTL